MIPSLYVDLCFMFWRAIMSPWTTPLPSGVYPPTHKPGARRAENRSGAQETGAARAMTAPVERASDWDEERRSGEVVEFRRQGRL